MVPGREEQPKEMTGLTSACLVDVIRSCVNARCLQMLKVNQRDLTLLSAALTAAVQSRRNSSPPTVPGAKSTADAPAETANSPSPQLCPADKRSCQQQQQQRSAAGCNLIRYKTELCRQYEESGTCRYGDKCQFAHGEREVRSLARHPKYKTEMCRTFHTAGFCPYGLRCHFIHNEEERRMSAPASVVAGHVISASGFDVTERLLGASTSTGSRNLSPMSGGVVSPTEVYSVPATSFFEAMLPPEVPADMSRLQRGRPILSRQSAAVGGFEVELSGDPAIEFGVFYSQHSATQCTAQQFLAPSYSALRV